MDSALMLIISIAAGLCWLAVMFDQQANPVLRVMGVFGIGILLWYLSYIIGNTHSPVWNDLTGGWLGIVGIAGGFMAFISKEEPVKAARHINRGAR